MLHFYQPTNQLMHGFDFVVFQAQFGAPPVQSLSVPQRASISRINQKSQPTRTSTITSQAQESTFTGQVDELWEIEGGVARDSSEFRVYRIQSQQGWGRGGVCNLQNHSSPTNANIANVVCELAYSCIVVQKYHRFVIQCFVML